MSVLLVEGESLVQLDLHGRAFHFHLEGLHAGVEGDAVTGRELVLAGLDRALHQVAEQIPLAQRTLIARTGVLQREELAVEVEEGEGQAADDDPPGGAGRNLGELREIGRASCRERV